MTSLWIRQRSSPLGFPRLRVSLVVGEFDMHEVELGKVT